MEKQAYCHIFTLLVDMTQKSNNCLHLKSWNHHFSVN